jgi:hypothetical protein
VTHPLSTVEAALQLHAEGVNLLQISKRLGVSRAAVREWIANPERKRERLASAGEHLNGRCSLRESAPRPEYAYLLGQYLGDGCISAGPRGVFKLRIAMCDDYPAIRERCMAAMEAVLPNNKAGYAQGAGCKDVYIHSKHWPCLLPQHGPGRKHERLIALESWQQEIVDAHPQEFLTGLIHSDGNRSINTIRKKSGKVYEYPRYFFTNKSEDIRRIFCTTCDTLGVHWHQNNWNNISIARSDDVAYLDQFIGPKT